MQILVEHLKTRSFLAEDGTWVHADHPLIFSNAIDAISFCVRYRIRTVRLIGRVTENSKYNHIYPFGHDPVVLQERRRLRALVREQGRKRKREQLLRLIDPEFQPRLHGQSIPKRG